MVPAGGTWREAATAVTEPMATRTARENDALAVPPFITIHRGAGGDVRTSDITGPLAAVTASGNHFGLAVPPLLVPVEGRDGKHALPASAPMRTQTARAETGLATHPLVTPGGPGGLAAGLAMVMRNNTPRGDPGQMCSPASEPLRTLTAAGHQSLISWEHLAALLIPYYRTGVARPVTEPAGTVTSTDRFALASAAVTVEDVLFRMLEPHEIGAAMAFAATYQVLGSKREKVRQLGNAVTPPVAEVLIAALAEAVTGEVLP